MKHPFITALVASLLCVTASWATPIDGFRDMRFGDAPEKLGESRRAKSLTAAPPTTDEQCFSRASDKLALATTPVESIEYCFYKGKLFTIIITGLNGAKTENNLLTALTSAYGEPRTVMGTSFWGSQFESTAGAIMLANFGNKLPMAIISSNVVRQQRKRDEENAAKSKL